MTDSDIIKELEELYQGFRDLGDNAKATEVMIQIINLRKKNEASEPTAKNILLG